MDADCETEPTLGQRPSRRAWDVTDSRPACATAVSVTGPSWWHGVPLSTCLALAAATLRLRHSCLWHWQPPSLAYHRAMGRTLIMQRMLAALAGPQPCRPPAMQALSHAGPQPGGPPLSHADPRPPASSCRQSGPRSHRHRRIADSGTQRRALSMGVPSAGNLKPLRRLAAD